ATVAVVLPDGVADLDTAATHFATSLKAEQRTHLDQALQEGVLGPLGGLYTACSNASDPMRTFVMPLLDQAAAFLDQHLPITDVAQVELDLAKASGEGVAAQIKEYLNRATPVIEGKDTRQQSAFVLIPATDAGKAYADVAQQAAPELQQVRVP